MYLQRIWWWVGLAHSAWLATIGLLEASGRIALSGAVFRLGSRSLERADSWLCASLAYPGEARHKRVLTASGATATMQLLIQEVPATDAPIDLLLIADPSKDKVLSYLSRSRCFVASSEPIVGVCVVQPLGEGAYELMSIAVPPSHQKCGYGTALLKWVIDFFRKSGARQIEVGTGTFGYQLAFYQRHGFRVTGIDRDFFIRNYPEPIFEDGIQLFDMLRLTLRYPGSGT